MTEKVDPLYARVMEALRMGGCHNYRRLAKRVIKMVDKDWIFRDRKELLGWRD